MGQNFGEGKLFEKSFPSPHPYPSKTSGIKQKHSLSKRNRYLRFLYSKKSIRMQNFITFACLRHGEKT